MYRLLLATLLLGGCAGRSAPVLTPQNIKRGSPKIYIKAPAELRYNTTLVVGILISGNDSRFTAAIYVLRIQCGPDVSKFQINPRILRGYRLKMVGRDSFKAYSGRMTISVSLHPVLSYTWDGKPVIGNAIVSELAFIEMKGSEA